METDSLPIMTAGAFTSRTAIATALAFGAFAADPSTAALSFTLTSPQVTHSFDPGLSPFPPQATDAVDFDCAGVALAANDNSTFEFLLAAPSGFLFHIDPGPYSWQLGFTLGFSEEVSDMVFTRLEVMFLDPGAGFLPELQASGPGGPWGGTTLGGFSLDPLAGPLTFRGLRVTCDVNSSPPAAFTLDSASFSFFTRNLPITTDPGAALVISPVPEPAVASFAVLGMALLLAPRRTGRVRRR